MIGQVRAYGKSNNVMKTHRAGSILKERDVSGFYFAGLFHRINTEITQNGQETVTKGFYNKRHQTMKGVDLRKRSNDAEGENEKGKFTDNCSLR